MSINTTRPLSNYQSKSFLNGLYASQLTLSTNLSPKEEKMENFLKSTCYSKTLSTRNKKSFHSYITCKSHHQPKVFSFDSQSNEAFKKIYLDPYNIKNAITRGSIRFLKLPLTAKAKKSKKLVYLKTENKSKPGDDFSSQCLTTKSIIKKGLLCKTNRDLSGGHSQKVRNCSSTERFKEKEFDLKKLFKNFPQPKKKKSSKDPVLELFTSKENKVSALFRLFKEIQKEQSIAFMPYRVQKKKLQSEIDEKSQEVKKVITELRRIRKINDDYLFFSKANNSKRTFFDNKVGIDKNVN